MHELSLAQNIVEIIQKNVLDKDLNKVRSVKIKVGAVAGVVPDSLQFSYQAITSDCSLKNSELVVEEIPFANMCNACSTQTINDDGFAMCTNCGSFDVKNISGTELQLSEISLAD